MWGRVWLWSGFGPTLYNLNERTCFVNRAFHSYVRRTLFSHRICGWVIKSPRSSAQPQHTPARLSCLPSFFLLPSKLFKVSHLTSAALCRRRSGGSPADAPQTPTLSRARSECVRTGSAFRAGRTCERESYLFSLLSPANSCTQWGLVDGNLIPPPGEERNPNASAIIQTVVGQLDNGRWTSLLSKSRFRVFERPFYSISI